jgi:hypothetical protein
MHDNDYTSDLLIRLIAQRRKVANLCTCGRIGTIYADDGYTVLCGKCWIAIYLPKDDSDDR